MCRFRCLSFEAAVVVGGRDPDAEALRLDLPETQLDALDEPPTDEPPTDEPLTDEPPTEDPPELERDAERFDVAGGRNVERFGLV